MSRSQILVVAVAIALLALLPVAFAPVSGRSIAPPAPDPDPVAPGGGYAAEPSLPAEPEGDAWDRAEASLAEGSYARALAALGTIDVGPLSADDARWLRFRTADATWRNLAATRQAEDTDLVAALDVLRDLSRADAPAGSRDRIWIEARESLADFHWMSPSRQDWGAAWSDYRAALDGWAASRNLELARTRYLAIVRKAARIEAPGWWREGSWRPDLPVDVLEGARNISVDPGDVRMTSYLLATALARDVGNPARYDRAERALLDAVDVGRGGEWHDDALWALIQLRASRGRPVRTEDDRIEMRPDYRGAVAALREFLEAFPDGTSRYRDEARRLLDDIVSPSVDVRVGAAFLPDSEIEYVLSWRNVGAIELTLTRVDLVEDLGNHAAADRADLLAGIVLDDRGPERRWTHATNDDGEHDPGIASLRLDDPLPPGAWILAARADDRTSRTLVLVTGIASILRSDGATALVYVGDAATGSPVPDAEVAVQEATHRRGDTVRTLHRARTDAEGIARIALSKRGESRQLRATVSRRGEPATASTWVGAVTERPAGIGAWKILAFPDRPAYRPGETVSWKAIARTIAEDSGRSTPSGRAVDWTIQGPRGDEIARGTATFNDFGGIDASFDLPADAALGTYQVRFHPAGDGRQVAAASLFVVEEYRLPEFRVDVRPPEDEDGRVRSFRPGEEIEVEIAATYYDGAPVAGGTATVVVRQRPLWIRWAPRPRFAWLETEAASRPAPYARGGSVLQTTTIALDAEGRGTLTVSPPVGLDADTVYAVEARVVDAARREVAGTGEVRITRQAYFAHATVERRVVRPGDAVVAEFRTSSPDESPRAAEGTVRVTRRVWDEVWFDPWGREVRGRDLARAKERADAFPPPPPEPGGPSWRLHFRGYRDEPVLTRTVRTGEDGEGSLRFTPERAGWYRIAWDSEPGDLWPVTAETSVWVTDADTETVGYRPGGVEIVVDRDAFRVGEEAVVFVTTESPGTPVLFTIEPDGVETTRLLRMDGDGRLLRIPLDERHAPNVHLHAAAMFDARVASTTVEVAVAPAGRTFDVAIDLGEGPHRPGSEIDAVVRAVGEDGEPVDAEIALAVRDEAVEAIAPDFAGDPRAFFLTDRRGSTLRQASSFDERRYVRLRPPSHEERERTDDGTVEVLLGVPESEARQMAPSASNVTHREKSMMAEAAFEADLAVPEGPAIAGELDAVEVRSDFRATALWAPTVRTGEDGVATVRLNWPESLTSWHAVARGAGTDVRFGHGEATARTSRPLTVRLRTPRFLVAGDAVTISALVRNNGDAPLRIATTLDSVGVATDRSVPRRAFDLAPGDEARADWTVRAIDPGAATFTVRAAAMGGPDESDGMRLSIPVVEHGIDKLVARSGKVRGGAATVLLDVPAARRPGSTTLTVRVTPSLAVTALDALPYLIDYPYGCTEQTLSRFLPAILVRRTLVELGLDPEEVEGRMFGGIEAEHARSVQGDREPGLGKLDDVVRKGVARLADFQHGDGGWGWWKEGASDPFMSAYALWGLSEAAAAGVDVDRRRLRRAAEWLGTRLVRYEGDPDMQAWMLHALAVQATLEGRRPTDLEGTAFASAYADRERAGAYGRALLALTAQRTGRVEEARVLVRNLENGVIRDDDPDRSVLVEDGSRGGGALATAHWGADRIGYRWSEGAVETTAFALRALLAIDPDHALVEPATTWLVRNRRGAQWRHTRETAIAVLALTDVLAARGAPEDDLAYAVEVNGRRVGDARVTADTVLRTPAHFDVDPSLVRNGENRIRIVREDGDGPLYFAVEARFFSREEPVTPAGNQLYVGREYVVRSPFETLLAGTRYDRTTLVDEGAVASGDRIEAVLTVEAKTDLEYLVFEDGKPAGFEAVDLRSGGGVVARRVRERAAGVPAIERRPEDYTGEQIAVVRELRDRRVVTFVDRLPEGFWELRYELRAETPGRFHGLPTVAHAMYVPEIRGNGAEHRVVVDDGAP